VSWAHEHLGIGDDADERAIKRAYAVKLRTTRPDEDPEGFQQLNDAYQTALEMLRHRLAQEQFAGEQGTGDSGQEAPLEPAVVDETAAHASLDDADRDSSGERATGTIEDEAGDVADAAPQGEAITLDQFLDACLGAAGDGDPRVLEHWLRSQPVLWSLEHKAMIGHWLLRLMDARQPPMTERNFDMLAEFFGYNDLHAGYDPLGLQRLRARLIESWRELQAQRRWQRPTGESLPSSAYSFASIAQPPPAHRQAPPFDERQERARREQAWRHRLMHEFAHLVERPNRLRDLRLLMNPDHPATLRAFLGANPWGGLGNLPADIRRDAVVFWLSVADDRRWHYRRVLVAMLRCAVVSLPILPVALLLQMTDAPEDGSSLSIAITSVLLPFAALMAFWCGVAGFKSWLYWQGAPPPVATWKRIAHRPMVPALLLASMLAMYNKDSPSSLEITFGFAMLALWTALFRFRARLRAQRRLPPLDVTARHIALMVVATMFAALLCTHADSEDDILTLAIYGWIGIFTIWAIELAINRKP
jgi:hypothetical protein